MLKYLNKIKDLIHGRFPVISVPYFWLILFFLLPFLIVLKISVSEMETTAISPLMSYVDGALNVKIKFTNFMSLFNDEDQYYLWTYLRSIGFAAATTVLCLLIGYPFAYFMARSPIERRPALLMLVMLPFWTSFLLRIYAWKGILETNGLLNNFLIWLGVIREPMHMMHTKFSLILGMVYTYLPFMILPLYSNLVKLDNRFLEAAADLGATPLQTFWRITIPLSKAGIIAGAMLVFIPCIGEFVIPELLGGPETLMIGRVLWDEFFSNNDWPRASAVAVVMILLIIVPLAIFNKYEAEQLEGKKR
jgi:putrescine transport system permease protein